MAIELYHGDILDLDVDAIVNAASTELQHGGSLAADIVRRGGRSIQEESEGIGWCDLGSAVLTGAGSLAARYVIHVPTIDHVNRRRATLQEVEKGTRAALALARQVGIGSIAFPLLGAGFAGIKAEDVARAMKRAMADFAEMRIVICVHWQDNFEAVQAAILEG